MRYKIILHYSDLFDDFELTNIEKQLDGIPTINVIATISRFLAQLHTPTISVQDQINLFWLWCGKLPSNVVLEIREKLKLLRFDEDTDFTFLTQTAGLQFIQEALSRSNNFENIENLSQDIHLRIFKGYLLVCESIVKKQHDKILKPEENSVMGWIKLTMPSQMPFTEIEAFKAFPSQFLKSIYFFAYCNNNPKFKVALKVFLEKCGLKNWRQYVMGVFSCYTKTFDPPHIPNILSVSEDQSYILGLLDSLSFDHKHFISTPDFKGIRQRPLYRLEKYYYAFLNLNFWVDKIYQGIQFEFAKIAVASGASKSIPDFFSYYAESFAENELFYKVMRDTITNKSFKKLSGQEMKKILKEGEPDFYIRDKKKVYLFEFKNTYLAENVRHSQEYKVIHDELIKKMVVAGKNETSRVGVGQLVNSIAKIQTGSFNSVDDFDFNDAIIYPIIVYVDSIYNTHGINYLLNVELKKRVSLLPKSLYNTHIKDLIIVHIDTFLEYQHLFKSKTITLNNCFNEFYKSLVGFYPNGKRDQVKAVGTFDDFMHNKTLPIIKERKGNLRSLEKEIVEILSATDQ